MAPCILVEDWSDWKSRCLLGLVSLSMVSIVIEALYLHQHGQLFYQRTEKEQPRRIVHGSFGDTTSGSGLEESAICVSNVKRSVKSRANKLNVTLYYGKMVATNWTKPFHYMTAVGPGRLGNQMFTFAALLGIASYHGYEPVLHPRSVLANVFDLSSISVKQSISNIASFTERSCCTYDRRVERLQPNQNWTIGGYFQSWKYFRYSQRLVRKTFRFQAHILHDVMEYLRLTELENCTLIGVHVRRTDTDSGPGSIAGMEYINKSIQYFRNKYPGAKFIVCSDDKVWCKMHIYEPDVIVSPFEDAGVDLAVLAHCDHVIITSGTFGWWGAWLAGGEVVFYDQLPAVKAWMTSHVTKEDFYPAQWTGIK